MHHTLWDTTSHPNSLMTYLSLPSLFLLLALCHPVLSASRSASVDFVTSADFVIVGAGTAGCVLASRLCRGLPNTTVLLLERGQPRNKAKEFLIRSPRNVRLASEDPLLSEIFHSEPNEGLLGRKVNLVTGNTLGGSSAINGMQWTVPLEGTVERWNVEGLSSKTARKFFRRAYRVVGFAEPPEALQQIYTRDYIQAAEAAGIPEDHRLFTEEVRDGVWVNRLAIDKIGRRRDSFSVYLGPSVINQCRNNLRIFQGVTVTRLLLGDQLPLRVSGVEFAKSDATRSIKMGTIQAAQEVLLTAGPYGSPKLLQLSGIGPREVLQNLDIPVKADLGVGTKVQSRSINFLNSIYDGVPLDPSGNETLLNSRKERRRWENGKGGALGVAGGAVNGILRKIGYFFAVLDKAIPGSQQPVFGSFCVANPKRYGYLRIKSKNPFMAPSVQVNLLRKKSELSDMRACLERLRTVHSSFPPPFKMRESFPMPGTVTSAWLRNTTGSALHFVGGCAVDTVVDGNLKVKGVLGLRVIDSSVFKSMPLSAGPLASTYMLAEYASDGLVKLYQ